MPTRPPMPWSISSKIRDGTSSARARTFLSAEHQARGLTAGGDLDQRLESFAGVRGDEELHAGRIRSGQSRCACPFSMGMPFGSGLT
ncbi:MAG: hypothetical protein MZV64_17145 [Ignavibacteriales bacterium]|nr:hypothetical protein [Ignavibacteriales bacterium]